jgi:hypothetical protein
MPNNGDLLDVLADERLRTAVHVDNPHQRAVRICPMMISLARGCPAARTNRAITPKESRRLVGCDSAGPSFASQPTRARIEDSRLPLVAGSAPRRS